MTFKSILYTAAILSVSPVASAGLVTLDFEAPSIVGRYFLDGELFIDDSVQAGTTGVNGAASIINPPASYTTGPNNGSAYVQSSVDSSIFIDSAGYGVFSLLSLDLGEYSQYANTVSVTITGFKQGGGQVSDILQLDNLFDGLNGMADFQRLQFDSDWSGLTRVEFDSGAYSLDNIQLNLAAVPVPAAIWLFASGLVGILGLRRK